MTGLLGGIAMSLHVICINLDLNPICRYCLARAKLNSRTIREYITGPQPNLHALPSYGRAQTKSLTNQRNLFSVFNPAKYLSEKVTLFDNHNVSTLIYAYDQTLDLLHDR